MEKPAFYVVSNGRLVLHLEPAEEGGYLVTSPFDSALITEAETIEEAFEMAEDAAQTLADGRAKLMRGGRDAAVPRRAAKRRRGPDFQKPGGSDTPSCRQIDRTVPRSPSCGAGSRLCSRCEINPHIMTRAMVMKLASVLSQVTL